MTPFQSLHNGLGHQGGLTVVMQVRASPRDLMNNALRPIPTFTCFVNLRNLKSSQIDTLCKK